MCSAGLFGVSQARFMQPVPERAHYLAWSKVDKSRVTRVRVSRDESESRVEKMRVSRERETVWSKHCLHG